MKFDGRAGKALKPINQCKPGPFLVGTEATIRGLVS